MVSHVVLALAIAVALFLAFGLHFGIVNAGGQNPPPQQGNAPTVMAPTSTPKATPVPINYGGIERFDKSKQAYYNADGICGWWDETEKKYVKPAMNYPNALKSEKEEDGDKPYCLYEFHKRALHPVCGDAFFSMFKYCSMVTFYNNQPPAPLTGENNDVLLLLIDGCAICKSKVDLKVKVSLQYEWPAGSFFSGCSKETRTASSIDLKEETFNRSNSSDGIPSQNYYAVVFADRKNENGSRSRMVQPLKRKGGREIDYKGYQEGPATSFSLAPVLYQRICKAMFGTDPKPEEYQGVQLVVEHNCGGDQKSQTVPLPNIKPGDFKNNMAELRGLLLLLDDEEWQQFSMDDISFKNSETLEGKKPVLMNKLADEV